MHCVGLGNQDSILQSANKSHITPNRSTKNYTRSRVHKAFQNQDQDQAQVKKSSNMYFFKTYYNYLTID